MSIKNIVIEQYNGSSFDEIYPQTSVEQVQGFTEAVYALGADATYKVGDVLSSIRTNLGNKWLLCNGQIIDAEEYPELYELSKNNNKYLNIDMGIYSGGNSAINCEYVNGQYFITNAEINPANNKELGIKIVYGDGIAFSNPKVIYYNVAGSDSDSNATYQSISVKYGNGQYAFMVRTQNYYYGVYYTSNLEQDWTYKAYGTGVPSDGSYETPNGLMYVNNKWFLLLNCSSGSDSGNRQVYFYNGSSVQSMTKRSAVTRSNRETGYMQNILYINNTYVATIYRSYNSVNYYLITSSDGNTWKITQNYDSESGYYDYSIGSNYGFSITSINNYLYALTYYENSFNMYFFPTPTSTWNSAVSSGTSYSGNRYYEVGDYIVLPYTYSSNYFYYRKKTDTDAWKNFNPYSTNSRGTMTDIIYHNGKYYVGCIDSNKAYVKYTSELGQSLSSSQIYAENVQTLALCAKGNKLIAYFGSSSPQNGYITYSENGTTWSTPTQVYSGYMSPIGFEASMEDVVMLKYNESSTKLMMYAKSDNLNVWTKKSYQPTTVWPEGYYYSVSTGSSSDIKYYNYYGDDVENPILFYDGGSSPLSKVQELFYYKQLNGIVSISKNEILGAPAVPEIALDGCYTYIKSKE